MVKLIFFLHTVMQQAPPLLLIPLNRLKSYNRGGQTFSLAGQISKLFFIWGRTSQKITFFDAYWGEIWTVLVQISINGLIRFAFPSNKEGPRAANLSWRAACGPRASIWPCLSYNNNQMIPLTGVFCIMLGNLLQYCIISDENK